LKSKLLTIPLLWFGKHKHVLRAIINVSRERRPEFEYGFDINASDITYLLKERHESICKLTSIHPYERGYLNSYNNYK